jgi:hypothetical protein
VTGWAFSYYPFSFGWWTVPNAPLHTPPCVVFGSAVPSGLSVQLCFSHRHVLTVVAERGTLQIVYVPAASGLPTAPNRWHPLPGFEITLQAVRGCGMMSDQERIWWTTTPQDLTLTIMGPCWGTALALTVYPVVAFLRGPMRRARRRLRGSCLQCGYSLTGLIEPRCPECGRAFVLHTVDECSYSVSR